MRKIIAIILSMLIVYFGHSQNQKIVPSEHPPLNRPNDALFPINCSDLASVNCNYIRNINFNHPNYNWQTDLADPFGLDKVPEWYPASGSPTIYDGFIFNYPPPPTGTSGYFFAAGDTYLNGGIIDHNYEGIVQKIPVLIPGHVYVMSFFKAKKDYSIGPNPTYYPIDRLNVRFIYCSDYNATFNPNSTQLPPVPANNQQVYCETNVDHIDWQQVFIKFSATQAFNMIWIYPDEDPVLDRHAGLHFAYPELIDVTALQNQVIQGSQPNCMATLPNCGPINSTFNWEGPHGQYISSPSGQTVQIDVSNPLNVGVWTGTIIIPSASISNNTCSQNIGSVSFSVNLSECSLSTSWLKIYEQFNMNSGNPPLGGIGKIIKGANSNIYYSFGSTNISNNIGHVGSLPSLVRSKFITQYNSVDGLTSWVKPDLTDEADIFVLDNGNIRTKISSLSSQYIYLDGATGNQVPGPSSVSIPGNDQILAETNAGSFITYNSGQIFVRTSNTVTSISSVVGRSFYNKATDRLYVQTNTDGGLITVYSLSANSLTYVASFDPGINVSLYHVDNQDNLYTLPIRYNSGMINKYAIISNVAVLLPFNISGFINSNLVPLKFGLIFDKSYTSDKYMVFNNNDSKLHVIDIVNNTTKSISATGSCFSIGNSDYGFNYCTYSISGDEVYISGWVRSSLYYSMLATIGAQSIVNVVPNGEVSGGSVFIKKLSIANDMGKVSEDNVLASLQTRDLKNFEVNISPNPVINNLVFSIKRSRPREGKNILYKLIISNRSGNVILERTINSDMIIQDITNLRPGVYFITIADQEGEKVTKMFTHL